MPSFSVIAIIACFAYAIESIFGFGGTIIFLGISGLIYDFESLLKLAMIVGLSSGLAVLIQSFKHLSFKHLGIILIYTTPGALIGTMMITYLASEFLIKLFSIILIIYGIQIIGHVVHVVKQINHYFFVDVVKNLDVQNVNT